MKTYTTRSVARIGTGILLLSPAQAEARRANLRELGGQLFEVVAPVEFKTGETFGFDQELPCSLVACLQESELPVEDMEQPQLLALAQCMGLNPHPKTGKAKLLEAIQAKKEALRASRIADLEALGDQATPEELFELATLMA